MFYAQSNSTLYQGESWNTKWFNFAYNFNYSSVQYSSRRYLWALKSPYALHPVSQKFPQRCLWNGSNVRLTDDGLLSSFQGRSSSASSFHASLLQEIDGVMSLALCPQVVSQASQHFRSSRSKAPVRVALPCLFVYLLGHFPSLRHVQGSTPTGVFEGGCQPSTHSNLDTQK